MKFRIVTPQRLMLEEEVDSVTLPTQLGEITILPKHISLVASLKPGEIKYKQGQTSNFFAVSGGVIEVQRGSDIVVLADTAEFGHEIDLKRAQEARDLAKKMMQESYKDEQVFAEAATLLEKNLARIKVAHKHRTHTHKNLESGILHE